MPIWVPIAAALGGAVVGAFLKFVFDVWVKDRRRLLVLCGTPRVLFPARPEWRGKIDVLVSGAPVPQLSEIEFELRNTGNRSIPDLHVVLELTGDARFVASDPAGSEVVAPLGIEVETLEERWSSGEINLDFLNPGERRKYRFLVDRPETKLTASFRQADVSCKVVDLEEFEQASFELSVEAASLLPMGRLISKAAVLARKSPF